MFDSPAPKVTPGGRWLARAALPLPRSEMAWALEYGGKMHMLGGYGEQRVDRAYHQVYDPVADRWSDAAALPRGANHVGVAVLERRLYAVGGHVEQNRRPHDECFVYEAAGDRWQKVAPLPTGRDYTGTVVIGNQIHVVGGRVDSFHTNSNLHHASTRGQIAGSRAAPCPPRVLAMAPCFTVTACS